MENLLKQKKLLENKLEECKNSTSGMLMSLLFKTKYQKEYDEINLKIKGGELDMNEYVIIYKTGEFYRETRVNADNKEDAIQAFICMIGNYEIQLCELSN